MENLGLFPEDTTLQDTGAMWLKVKYAGYRGKGSTMKLTKKQRRQIRSKFFPNMHPHIFDKLVACIPHVLLGVING